MTDHFEDAAARLYSFLTELQSYPKANAKCEIAFAKVLDIDPSNTTLLLRRVGLVLKLPADVRQSVRSVKDANHDLYLNSLTVIEKQFVELNLKEPLHRFLGPINSAALQSLQFCSDLLSKNSSIEPVQFDEIKSLKSEIDTLFDSIEKSSIDPELKEFMLERTGDILSALQEYRIVGISAIQTSVEATIGSLVTRQPLWKRGRENEKFKDFWRFFSKLATLVTVGQGLTLGADLTIKLLSL